MWRSAFVTVHIQSVGAFQRRRKRENAPAAKFLTAVLVASQREIGGK
jgi:hypothetical protein